MLHLGQALPTYSTTSHMWLGSTVVSLVLRKAEPCGQRPVLPTGKRNPQNVACARKLQGQACITLEGYGDTDPQHLMKTAVPDWLVERSPRAVALWNTRVVCGEAYLYNPWMHPIQP